MEGGVQNTTERTNEEEKQQLCYFSFCNTVAASHTSSTCRFGFFRPSFRLKETKKTFWKQTDSSFNTIHRPAVRFAREAASQKTVVYMKRRAGGGEGGRAVYDRRLQPNVQTVAPISNLRPSIKARRSNRGGEPSARRSPALLCSHVSEKKPIRGHTLPLSGTDERLEADCLRSSAGFVCCTGPTASGGLNPLMTPG